MPKTHHCNQLQKNDIGTRAQLVGWIQSARDHGGVIFVDLRDREGMTQIVFRPEENESAAKISHTLREEDVIEITGTVAARLEGTINEKLPTGEIEVVVSDLVILNKADVLPFQIDRELSNEDLRLQYRYLDLRRPRLRKNLTTRHQTTKTIRDFLSDAGYLEIETPILSKSTPEGARDFLVPSRMNPGKFYALPQAPQQYKQLLMVAGVEKYFQIARCFRDEDLRADRQPEFTQVDLESSFVTPEDLFALMEDLMVSLYKKIKGVEINAPFPHITYQEAMDRYGSDRPDTRYGIELQDVSDIFTQSNFKVFSGAIKNGGVVKAINAKGFANISTGQINTLTELAIQAGAKGLAYIQVREGGNWRSPITKFISEEEKTALTQQLDIQDGDLILFGADKWHNACEVLGRIRTEIATLQKLLENNTDLHLLWVTDFPLLAYNEEEEKWNAVHHPFTRPKAEDLPLLEDPAQYGNIRAEAYDLVINGFEAGGGSIRIHESKLQQKIFHALGISEQEQNTQFAHLLEAFRYGAPPHGGLALGLDRLVAHFCDEDSIREVIPFPKNNRGLDLMTQAPADPTLQQLRELRIDLKAKKK